MTINIYKQHSRAQASLQAPVDIRDVSCLGVPFGSIPGIPTPHGARLHYKQARQGKTEFVFSWYLVVKANYIKKASLDRVSGLDLPPYLPTHESIGTQSVVCGIPSDLYCATRCSKAKLPLP